MKTIQEFLIAATVLLLPFQDSGLQHLPIGILGASPSFIPLSLLIGVHFLEWLFNNRRLSINRSLIFIVGYVLIISTIYLVISGTESHGRNLLAKTFNLSVLTFLLLYPAFFINYKNIPRLGLYIKIAFVITLVGIVFNDLLMLDFVRSQGIIHASATDNIRPRGFTGEASYLSIMLMSLGMLSAHFSKEKTERIVFVALTILATAYSTSKGGLVTILAVAAFVVFFKSDIRRWLRLALIVAVIIAASYAVDLLLLRFTGDIQSGISTATRSGLMITTVLIVAHNPLGVGFAGFLPAIDKYVPQAIKYMDSIFDLPFDFTEIIAYLGANTDRTISTKTFLFDNLAFFGLPFLIIYIVFHYRLITRLIASPHTWLLAGALFCMIAISTYIPALGMYSISFVYGVALNELRG
ncbi:MAG: hypothetical protein GY841_17480 [FCB group bacterium]|nr:hypothetical protein [FCB group bacterium]